MGNIKSNGLPQCPALDALYSAAHRPVPFWIDTACVPRRYPARGIAITAMRDIYKNADKVLVLDKVLMTTKGDASAVEILQRIRSSTWATRLWTYHEAGLAKDLVYQLEDIALDLPEIDVRHEKDRLLNDRSKVNRKQSAVWITKPLNRGDPELARIRGRLESLDLLWDDGLSFIMDLEVFSVKSRESAMDDHIRLHTITTPLRWRWTSRLRDETICLSGLLGRDVDDLINLTGENRMKQFLLSLKTVPDGILFAGFPRLQEAGYRWMPSTFLSYGAVGIISCKPAIPTSIGLGVTLPGFFIDMENGASVTQAFDNSSEDIYVDVVGHVYRVGFREDSHIQWAKYLDQNIAVVLESTEDHSDTMRGILVAINQFSPDSIQYCSFEHVVIIWGWEEFDEIPFEGRPRLYKTTWKTTQKWCIG